MGDERDYIVTCYKCGSTNNLKMYPHRSAKTGKMVGWIFVCAEHDETELPETLELV
jgi:hypothetical protein